MKTRNAFVSNSSSCSFLLMTNAKNEKEFKKAFKFNEQYLKECILEIADEYDLGNIKTDSEGQIFDEQIKDEIIKRMWQTLLNDGYKLGSVRAVSFEASSETDDLVVAVAANGVIESSKVGKIQIISQGGY